MTSSLSFVDYLKTALTVACVLVLTNCSSKNYLGMKVEDDKIKQIKVGVTTANQVVSIMGALPTFTTEEDMFFFYGSQDTRDIVFLKDVVGKGTVWEISFDDKKVVKSLRAYNLVDLKDRRMANYNQYMRIFRPL